MNEDVDIQTTMLMLKPDTFERGIVGQVLDVVLALAGSGNLDLIALKMVDLSQSQAKQFYRDHDRKPFFPALVEFITSGSCIAMVLVGEDAVTKGRAIVTEIRKNYVLAGALEENVIHGSDCTSAATREMMVVFNH